jgi:hypothetical protein
VEVDLTGIDRLRAPRALELIGSIKWRDQQPFNGRDLAALNTAAVHIPGIRPETRRVGVSASGFTTADLDLALGPEDLLAAWRYLGT